jgi:hypothetical protein
MRQGLLIDFSHSTSFFLEGQSTRLVDTLLI